MIKHKNKLIKYLKLQNNITDTKVKKLHLHLLKQPKFMHLN